MTGRRAWWWRLGSGFAATAIVGLTGAAAAYLVLLTLPSSRRGTDDGLVAAVVVALVLSLTVLVGMLLIPHLVRPASDADRAWQDGQAWVFRALGFRRDRTLWGWAVIGVACGAVWVVIVRVMAAFPVWPPAAPGDPRVAMGDGASLVHVVIVGLLVAPLSEEWLRGVLLLFATWLRSRSSAPWTGPVIGTALVAQAAWFGAWHLEFSVFNAVTAGLLGMIAGVLVLRSRSLWPALACHGTYNAIVMPSFLWG